MKAAASRLARPRVVTVVRRRRSFGLDAPRPPDVHRIETEVRTWFEAHLPCGLVLRSMGERDEGLEADACTLVVLLPACRIVVLRIETGPADRRRAAALAAECRSRRIPLALVSSVADVQAALRRIGFEPEEN